MCPENVAFVFSSKRDCGKQDNLFSDEIAHVPIFASPLRFSENACTEFKQIVPMFDTVSFTNDLLDQTC